MTPRLRLLRFWLMAGALTAVAGCAVGVQQAAVLPWVQGNWRTTGADLVVRDPATGSTLPVHVGTESGAISLATATQIMLALDLPFMRLSAAPAILGRNDLEFIQADVLYKHLIIDEPGRRWWLLGGLGVTILNSGYAYTSSAGAGGSFAGKTVAPTDTVNYSVRKDASGAYAALGAQVELLSWLHGYAELLLRLTHTEKEYESLTVTAGNETLNLLSKDANLTIDRTLAGGVTTDYTVPAVMLAIGVQFNLPSYRFTRRFVSWHAGKPENDEAPTLPESDTGTTDPESEPVPIGADPTPALQ